MTSYVLGVNSNIHDSSAALLADGEVVAFAEQERFDRKKHSEDFPVQAIEYCLQEGNIQLEDLEAVTFPFNSRIALPSVVSYFFRHFPKTIPLAVDRIKKGYFSFFYAYHGMRREMARYQKKKTFPFIYMEHHLCHAASAFFCSPFDSAAILSIDGVGEWSTTLFAKGEDNRIEKLWDIGFPHSVGLIYQAVTKHLGFRINSGEAKVMGLASFGDPTRYAKAFQNLVRLNDDGTFEINDEYFNYQYYGHNRMVSSKFQKLFGPPRRVDEEIEERHQDLAAAVQELAERITIHLAQVLHKKTGSKNLCLAGGVALNCVLNEKVKRNTPFDAIYVQPAANDAGGALGSPLVFHHLIRKGRRAGLMEHPYWGPAYSKKHIEQTLRRHGIDFEEPENIEAVVAQKIAQGNIVGWFQGRMEVGPRALGNRSILADPRSPQMKDHINQKVKHREEFRPFAPAVKADLCHLYFDSGDPSPFMLKVYAVQPEWREKLPAITHVDGTARVQTVTSESNRRFYSLIDEFHKLTDVGVLLNTSFNDNNEPIVCSPDDAVNCYLSTDIDCLAIGDLFCDKRRKADRM